jgi:aromatic amino acid aminotransferase I
MLPGLRAQYRERRDLCLDLFGQIFDLRDRSLGDNTTIYDGYVKPSSLHPPNFWAEKFDEPKQFPVISFVPPTSGMFLWVS